jgi:hypothetical protein
MVASCDMLFWNVFGPLFQYTTPCTVPSPVGSSQLSWWLTQWNRIQSAIVTVAAAWMEREQTLRASLTDDAQTVCLCLFTQFLFTSKVVKILYIHSVHVCWIASDWDTDVCIPSMHLWHFHYKMYMKCIMAYSALINHTTLFHCYHSFAIKSNESHNQMQYELSLVMLWRLSMWSSPPPPKRSRQKFDMP